jgi:hypothetical protein
MSTIKLVSVMERLAWAGKHIDAAHGLSNSMIQDHLYTFSAKQEGKGRVVVRATRVTPYPREFSLLVGDAAHNIRAALDNLAFAIVKPPPGKEKDVYFPISKTKAGFIEEARRKLPGVSVRVRAAFERLQPYHRRKMPQANNLARLHALNNWDKHRALAVCSVITGGVSIWPTITGPHTVKSVRIRQGILKEGAILAVIHISSVSGESDVKMRPEIKMAPVFDIGMPKEIRAVPVIEVLRRSLWYVERTVVPNLRKFI